MARAFALFEPYTAKLRTAVAFLNRHHPIVFDLRLKMSILRRFLPEGVNLGLAAFLDHLRKARRFNFQKFHAKIDKKSARELWQGGSNYRCCIPALAGFVSPQSIAPDGGENFAARSTSCNRVLLWRDTRCRVPNIRAPTPSSSARWQQLTRLIASFA